MIQFDLKSRNNALFFGPGSGICLIQPENFSRYRDFTAPDHRPQTVNLSHTPFEAYRQ